MRFNFKLPLRTVFGCMMIALLAFPVGLLAQSHIVSSADLQKQAVATSQIRQQNIQEVQQFLSSPVAQKAINSANVNPEQVKTAVSQLNDAELAQMAARAQRAQTDFAAGRLSDRDLALIILGVVALILIIVAVR